MKYLLITTLFLYLSIIAYSEKGVILVPVADLIGEPLSAHPINLYDHLPLCSQKLNTKNSCPRLHQSLYNEIVIILKEKGDELLIAIPQLFYITDDKEKKNTYWTQKKNVIPLSTLEKKKIDITKIPSPLSYEHPLQKKCNIATLIKPWLDKKTKLLFSAGTRFIIDQTTKTPPTHVAVFIIDPKKLLLRTITIDKNACIIDYPKNHHEQRKEFIHILKQWAHQPHCFIPYVWGGSSFTSCSHATTIETEAIVDNMYFTLTDYQQSPKTGFDCAGLVSRAAQIVGIPYFYKNTKTLAQFLKPLSHYESLQEGDLIWFPGHVMIISDIKNNLLIEARSYHHGYGKIHEISLDKVFKNIKNYVDLINALRSKKSIERIDVDGIIKEKISFFKILSLL